MTLYILAAFVGAVIALALLGLARVALDVGDRLMTPRPAPDEHRDVTPHIELHDMEVPA